MFTRLTRKALIFRGGGGYIGPARPGLAQSRARSARYNALVINDKQGRITGLRVQLPPRNVEKKNWQCKKHAQRNASANALYVCTIVMPGKAVWRV